MKKICKILKKKLKKSGYSDPLFWLRKNTLRPSDSNLGVAIQTPFYCYAKILCGRL